MLYLLLIFEHLSFQSNCKQGTLLHRLVEFLKINSTSENVDKVKKKRGHLHVVHINEFILCVYKVLIAILCTRKYSTSVITLEKRTEE